MILQGRFRLYLVAAGLALLFALPGVAADTPVQSTIPPSTRLLGARTNVAGPATTLTLDVKGDFSYHPAPSTDRLLFVDLPGVVSTYSPDSRLVTSALVSSYRMVPYAVAGQPGTRLEVLLKQSAAVSYRQGAGWLEVTFAPRTAGPSELADLPAAATPAVAAPNAAAPVAPSVSKATAAPRRAHGDAIERVTFTREAEGPRVRIVSNGPVEYKSFTVPNPPRLVIDIANTESASHEVPVGAAGLRTIRVAQFSRRPKVSRVVMELDGDPKYNISATPSGLEVALRPSALAAVSPSAPALEPKNPAVSSSAQVLTASLDARPLAVNESHPAAPAERTPALRVTPEPAREVRAVAQSTPARDLPPLAPMNVATATGQPPAQVAAAQRPPSPSPNPPTPVVPPQSPAPQAVGPDQSGAAIAATGPRYTGEPISVNLKDVDLKDFFRLIHEISGLNIVLDPNVSGRVTIVLEDVPWDQALDIVLRNNGLDKQLEGNVLRIARRDTLRREEEERLAFETARQAAADRVTVMRPLNYARASQLLTTLTKFRSPKGEIIADDRTNTLIITDIPQVIPTIDDVLRQLDRRSVQVEIEARVVSASRQFSRDVGAQFGFATSAGGSKTLFAGNQVGTQNASPIIVTGPDQHFSFTGNQLPLFSNFPAAGSSSGFSIVHRSPNASIDLLISLAETKGIGKLLSRPRIITQNNIQGSVQQGVKIPVQTTVNNTISVQFVDVTLRLQVRPQVTNEGTIFLDVTVANTTIDPGIARINGVPALDTQEATTQVLVSDGGTVVFGGVLQNQNNLTIQQVPILGSIPVIGNLFKRTGVNTNTNELLFFLTPKIV